MFVYMATCMWISMFISDCLYVHMFLNLMTYMCDISLCVRILVSSYVFLCLDALGFVDIRVHAWGASVS